MAYYKEDVPIIQQKLIQQQDVRNGGISVAGRKVLAGNM
jgi:hypothetical protein